MLPLLRGLQFLRRVVSVFVATLQGEINMDDFQGWHLRLMESRGQAASVTTLALEAHHKLASEVSFIHDFPRVVKSGITRGTTGTLMGIFKAFFKIFGPLVYMSAVEAGERHVFLCTSARYPAGPEDDTNGIPLFHGLVCARGADGQIGSGVYSTNADGESAKPETEKLLAQLRKQGMVETVWRNIEADIENVLTSSKGRSNA